MNGARTEMLWAPLLTHKDHPENWHQRTFISAGFRLWNVLQGWHRRGDMPKSLLAVLPDIGSAPTVEQLGRLTQVVPSWFLEHRPQTIAITGTETSGVEIALRLAGYGMRAGSHREALLEATGSSHELVRAKTDLAIIHNSTSWRLTAPLRATASFLREVRTGGGRTRGREGAR
jgi:hypothetical protein